MKANLNKSLDRLKHKVADREELWLEIFNNLIPVMLGEVPTEHGLEVMISTLEWKKEQIRFASELTDVALDEYETRWGKG